MNRPAKARVRLSFERAAASYDSAAIVQRRVCEQLLAGLFGEALPQHILDAGCGTGYARSLLQSRFPDAELLSLDLSLAMLRHTGKAHARIAGDLEQLPLRDHSIDLYWSSLAVQWCDLERVFEEARRVLQRDGQLAMSTLGPATFHELRTAFRTVDAHQHTLAFHPVEAIRKLLSRSGFASATLACRQETLHYPDLRSLLGAVKAVGANQVGPGRRTSLMSRSALTKLESAYEQQRQAEGLPLSYDIILIYATS